MKIAMKWITKPVELLLRTDARRATKFISTTEVVSVQRVGKKEYKRDATVLSLKIGRPNYEERAFIKSCQKAGEKFPVSKIQLRFPKKIKKGK